jgi:uncharacterized protein (DUF58 family)
LPPACRVLKHQLPASGSISSIRLDVARLGGLELVSEGIVEGFLSGLHRSPAPRFLGREFAEHRMYQPGDELRYVDWKMLGRSDRLYVKQYEEETNLRAMIVCDASKSMAWSGSPGVVLPKLAYAQRLIASLSSSCCGSATPPASSSSTMRCGMSRPPRARAAHWRQLLATLSA